MIKSATYGYKDRVINVTEIIVTHLKNNSDFCVSNNFFGTDPCPHIIKTLIIIMNNDEEYIFGEHDSIVYNNNKFTKIENSKKNTNVEIKIAISTNIDFYEKTIPILTESLVKSGIENHQIHIFCGGYDKQEITNYKNFYFYKLDHRSFDLSPLIAICEMELKTDYWFLIQDTCKVGLEFKEKIYKFPRNYPDKIALNRGKSMNMGLYKYEYLIKNKDYILKAKMFGNTPEELQKNKKISVQNEDYVLYNLNPFPDVYAGPEWYIYDEKNWYGDGTPRRTEYYPCVDIYKNKSNWYGREIYNHDL